MSRRKRHKSHYQDFNQLMLNNDLMSREYARLFQHYKNIAINRYRWDNLPEGIESRHIEERLFTHGQVFFTQDPQDGFLALSCSPQHFNVYNDPLFVQVLGNAFSKTYAIDEGVRILNNDLALASQHHVDWFAKRMSHLESIMFQNLQQQRIPYVIATTKETELSVKLMMENVMNGDLSIYVDNERLKEMNSNINVLSTQTPYLLDKLQQEKRELERELLEFLGINTTIEKKERLLVDETNANNDYITMNVNLGLKTRQLACDLINEKYGLNVSVVSTMNEIKSVQDIEDENKLDLEVEEVEEVEESVLEEDEVTFEDVKPFLSFLKKLMKWGEWRG